MRTCDNTGPEPCGAEARRPKGMRIIQSDLYYILEEFPIPISWPWPVFRLKWTKFRFVFRSKTAQISL